MSVLARVRPALWVVAVAAIASPFALVAPAADERGFLERLLGPFSRTFAAVQWVRADAALRHERFEEGYALAASAIELAPSDPGTWIALARHFVFDRASLEREPDARARRGWIRAAFDLFERGAPSADGRGELSFERGVLLTYLAEIADEPAVPPEELPWPGPASRLYAEAAQAFERAAERGDPRGRASAAVLHARAVEARERER